MRPVESGTGFGAPGPLPFLLRALAQPQEAGSRGLPSAHSAHIRGSLLAGSCPPWLAFQQESPNAPSLRRAAHRCSSHCRLQR